jgi:hypothetical protein
MRDELLDLQMEVDELDGLIHFIQNRLDAVALQVVGWMPPEDNEEHHNAVEMMGKARKGTERLRKRHRAISEALGRLAQE